jgi:5'-3' exonuclease
VIINTDIVGDYKEKFEEIYEVNMLPFKKRSTSEYIDEVKPYTELIEKINSKLRSLPNFSVNEKIQ